MTAEQIIQEIEAMPPEQQATVIRFVRRWESNRQMAGRDLERMADRMVRCPDPNEALKLREQIVEGFYGSHPDRKGFAPAF